MARKKAKKENKVEVVDLTTIKYPHSDIIQIEEVVESEKAIINEEVEETINSKNNDVVEEE